MKHLISLFIAVSVAFTAFGQSTPPNKLRSNDSFTQVDNYLVAAKRLGIPSGPSLTLDGATTPADAPKLFWRTSDSTLHVYVPALSSWLPAGGSTEPVVVPNLQAVTDQGNSTTNNINTSGSVQANVFNGVDANLTGTVQTNNLAVSGVASWPIAPTDGTHLANKDYVDNAISGIPSPSITLTGNVTGTGTGTIATTIANKSVTYARLQDIPSLSVIGRSSSGTGAPGAIQATANNHVLRVSGTTLGFGTIGNGSISDLAYSKLTGVPNFELSSNKATSFATVNNTLYPSTQAVSNFVSNLVEYSTYSPSIVIGGGGSVTGVVVHRASYMRVGNVVTVHVTIGGLGTGTQTGGSYIGITLPFPSGYSIGAADSPTMFKTVTGENIAIRASAGGGSNLNVATFVSPSGIDYSLNSLQAGDIPNGFLGFTFSYVKAP